MNSITIIVIIVVLLACLVCYAFISQTIEQKRQHRQRLLTALQLRANTFKYMLNNFPAGFLPRDLMLLVQRTLLDICEQLVRLDSKNPVHKQDLQMISERMNETRQQAAPGTTPALESPQQIQETKACLEELYKVIHQQEARKLLNSHEAEIYRAQIRQLTLGISIDSYILQGHLARQRGKLRLTQHYFELAQKLLVREDLHGAFDQKKARLQVWLEDLKKAGLGAVTHSGVDHAAEQAEIDKAWENFNVDDESWKKKNLYD